jgi:hypothetical protein
LCQFIHWPAVGAARFFAKAHEISALSKFNIAAPPGAGAKISLCAAEMRKCFCAQLVYSGIVTPFQFESVDVPWTERAFHFAP